jgi:hypothetical protein
MGGVDKALTVNSLGKILPFWATFLRPKKSFGVISSPKSANSLYYFLLIL